MTKLMQKFVARKSKENAYEVAVRLGAIGCDTSKAPNVAAKAKEHVRRTLRAKHRR